MYHPNALKLIQNQQQNIEDATAGIKMLQEDNENDFKDGNNVDVDVLESRSSKKFQFLNYNIGQMQVLQQPQVSPNLIERFDTALRVCKSDNAPSSKLNYNDQEDCGELKSNDKEDVKIAKNGEISDCELTAGGYTKKEFTLDNTLELDIDTKKSCKHFLDENPIPPISDMFSKEDLNNHHYFHHHDEQTSIVNTSTNCKTISNKYRVGGADDDSVKDISKCLDRQCTFNLNSDKLDLLGQKVECVYSLLSMLGSKDPLHMAKKFHELSRSTDTCVTLRRSGCIPLLIQMIYTEGGRDEVRKWAGMALHNVIHSHPDEKAGRREVKVLRLLDQIMEYCVFLRTLLQSGGETIADDADRHPLAAMSSLMKVSFDEEHRHAMCELGALHTIPNLVYLDHAAHGPKPESPCCNLLRRFALMALTNLTFGDENNKAFICSQKLFMEALITQLDSTPDDLLQVTASVLRNLSWRADAQMKAVLNEIGTVTALANAAMKSKCENTLKAILSALWNLSAHCSRNKAEFCAVDGALSFVVKMLNYDTLKIVENAGGILRNVSSHIAIREDYRQILREQNCLTILLQQLKSESLTVVSNSCGTLWNLSARCPQDQRFLWDNGAVPMLRSLINSKHAMIREGSACALKNLLNFRPSPDSTAQIDPIARSLNLKKLPTLNVRKQKALEQELGVVKQTLTQTCNDMDVGRMTEQLTCSAMDVVNLTKNRRSRLPLTSPLRAEGIPVMTERLTRSAILCKSGSRDSIFSAKSDTATYDHLIRSRSATETNRRLQHITASNTTSFTLKNDVEPNDDHPVDYAAKYKESGIKQNEHNIIVPPSISSSSYQETDLDQPTDFSLRYAENQVESYLEQHCQVESVTTLSSIEEPIDSLTNNVVPSDPSEIILILEDSVKCYQTEDTPYVISNATSITDLRNTECAKKVECDRNIPAIENKKINGNRCSKNCTQSATFVNCNGSRSYTPEKPINYCEEGTPGYFSRYESLISLYEAGQNHKKCATASPRANAADQTDLAAINKSDENKLCEAEIQESSTTAKINSALETPLMYSRDSSIDSLDEEDIEPIDDKSSVLSEFSRLASGIISPSEIPDSPTQNMPLSPCRNNELDTRRGNTYFLVGTPSSAQHSQSDEQPDNHTNTKSYSRSVFEDDLNMFHVENTPAQFSTATSLSNLSVLDEESCSNTNNTQKQKDLNINVIISETSEKENDNDHDDDDQAENYDLLLTTCINLGMNRAVDTKIHHDTKETSLPSSINHRMTQDKPKRHCVEDTSASLSKVGSHTNLSIISFCSNNNNNNSNNNTNDDITYGVLRKTSSVNDITNQVQLLPSVNRTFNFSDDMSSSTLENNTVFNNCGILQQCIRDGMQKSITKDPHYLHYQPNNYRHNDIIAKMRKGGNILPPYLVNYNDETNKYHTEDSPCNFSVTSGLSNLTVGSSLVGPAIKIPNNNYEQKSTNPLTNTLETCLIEEDSLSSLSIDSEDDGKLLSQAIAAGCNRPKSNLGFRTTVTASGSHKTASVCTNVASSREIFNFDRLTIQPLEQKTQTQSSHKQKSWNQHGKQTDNDTDSSEYSNDSNDNHSKSLFELCILTGMHKTLDNGSKATNINQKHHKSRKKKAEQNNITSCKETQSSPNLKQHNSLWIDDKVTQLNRPFLEQEKRDKKLLMECINTGIMKKVNESSKPNLIEQQQALSTSIYDIKGSVSSSINSQPKNGQATSVAVQQQMKKIVHHTLSSITTNTNIIPKANTSNTDIIPTVATLIPTITTAPDVGTDNNDNHDYKQLTIISGRNKMAPASHHLQHQEDITKHQKTSLLQSPSTLSTYKQKLANLENNQCKLQTTKNCVNVNYSSPNVNEICNNQINNVIAEKHKNPDLMLKSVERLTMEFVSSAEKLRTNALNNHDVAKEDSNSTNNSGNGNYNVDPKLNLLFNQYTLLAKKTLMESNSSRTKSTDICNDDDNTYPSNVSFPSVSITTQLTQRNIENDTEEAQATITEDSKKNLNDSIENVSTKPSWKSNISLNKEQEVKKMNEEQQINEDIDNTHLIKSKDNLSKSINFQLGGQVRTAGDATSPFSCSNNNNTINNKNNNNNNSDGNNVMISLISIGQEAQKLAENFQTFATDASNGNNNDIENDDNYNIGNNEMMAFSTNSLDLDNIGPPSGMNSLNMSSYYQDFRINANNDGGVVDANNIILNSSHKLSCNYVCNEQQPYLFDKSPKLNKKTLPIGLVARRTLGHLPSHLSGSSESVLSCCNIMLDNIKPPSLMDELLDSMVSVTSIQSEVIEDCANLATSSIKTESNYEAAHGDGNYYTTIASNDNCRIKENETNISLSLQHDNSTKSIVEASSNLYSTKNCNSLTPKQKRKLSKDRFKTYTIASDENGLGLVHENRAENGNCNTTDRNARLENEMYLQGDETLPIGTLKHNVMNSYNMDNEVLNSTLNMSIKEENINSNKSKIRTKKRCSQDRYKTQTVIFPSTIIPNQNNDALNNTLKTCDRSNNVTLERKLESGLCSLDDLQNFETESFNDCNVNYLANDNKGKNNDCVVVTTTTAEIVNDKLLANKNMESNQNVPLNKVIIGETKRFKYISPYSKHQQNVNQHNTISNINNCDSSKIVVTKSKNVNNNNKGSKPILASTATKKIMKAQNELRITKENTVNNSITTNKNTIKRQRTFIKEQPETANKIKIPIIETSHKSRSSQLKLPTKQHQPTTSTNTNFIKNQNHLVQIKKSNIRNVIKNRSAILNQQIKPQRANSNVTIRPKVNANRSHVLSRRISTTTPPSRSNSTMGYTATVLVNSSSIASNKIVQTKVEKMDKPSTATNCAKPSLKGNIKIFNNTQNNSNATTSSRHLKQNGTFSSTEVLKASINNSTTTSTTKLTPIVSTTKAANTTKGIRMATASNVQNIKYVGETKKKTIR